MILDRSHLSAARATCAIFVTSSLLYAIYAVAEPNGPSGGSWQGMLFGIAGTACMIYAGLLAGRKRVPTWQVGTAQTWLRGHIWIGLLSIPLILFHCGFRLGGLLEQLLLATFAVVILSGFFGLAMQQVLPRFMSTTVPAQAIAPQIHVAIERLRGAIESSIQEACGACFLEHVTNVAVNPNAKQSSSRSIQGTATAAALSMESSIATAVAQTPTNAGNTVHRPSYSPERELAAFYWDQLYDYLDPSATGEHPLANPTVLSARLGRLKDSVPVELHNRIEEIRAACDERRQLLAQSRIQNWLHGWLLLHVPLSVTLLVLGILHVVMSTYY